MKVVKNFLLGMMIVLLSIGVLVGCSTEKQSIDKKEADTTNKVESGKDIKKLVVWGGVPGESGPDAIVNEWNEKNPDIQVEYVRYVNDETGNTKLDTALLSGEQIDIFFTYTADLLQKRAESGMLEDLFTHNAEEFINNEILGGIDSILKVNNGVYAIPTVNEPVGIMINKDMLEEQGIIIPQNWTMNDFIEISRKLSGQKDGKKVYGSSVYYDALPLGVPMATLGGDYLYKSEEESNFDHPAFNVNTLLKEMMAEEIAMPYQEVFSRKLEQYSHPGFLNGEIAMMPFSAWMLRYVNDLENFPHEFITTFAPLPRIDENTESPYQSILNNYICMNSNSENKDEAWEFMKFWITEGSRHIAKMPAWNNANEDEIIRVILGDNPEKLFDVEAYKNVMLNDDLKYVVTTKTRALPEIMQIYKEESQKFFLNAVSPEEYYTNLKTKADTALKK